MTKFRFISILGLVLVASMSFGGQKDMIKPGPWSGVIINSGCTPDEAFAEAAKCTDKVPGGKLVLYDDTTRQIFDLDPQDKAIGHLGDGVTVAGTLEGNPEYPLCLDHSQRGPPSANKSIRAARTAGAAAALVRFTLSQTATVRDISARTKSSTLVKSASHPRSGKAYRIRLSRLPSHSRSGKAYRF